MPGRTPSRRDALAAFGLLAPAAAIGAAPADGGMAPEVRKAAEGRVDAARKVLDLCREMLTAPPGEAVAGDRSTVAEAILRWSRTLADARLDLAAGRDERLAILDEEATRAAGYVDALRALVKGDLEGLDRMTLARAEFYRVDAEYRLAREKAAG